MTRGNAVTAPTVGEAAARLPWLMPSAATLAAFARATAPAARWDAVRRDPGLLLLLARSAVADLPNPRATNLDRWLRRPAFLELLLHHLDHSPAGWVDPGHPVGTLLHRASHRLGHLAQALAEVSGQTDPACAWWAGFLAPLGWWAVAAVDPDRAEACLTEPRHVVEPAAVERDLWGLDHAAIARRLARHWQLPRWLATVVGHLGLPAEVAAGLGTDPALHALVRLAADLARRQGIDLGLLPEPLGDDACLSLGLTRSMLDQASPTLSVDDPPFPAEWVRPAEAPWLRDLLYLALENRRLSDDPGWHHLETDFDYLHQVVVEQQRREPDRLRTMKLAALAELAAGAGHEINNPLAVISGQAQYLLAREADQSRQRSLQTIINQAQRIHDILQGLMQFARPPRPHKEAVDLGELLRDVVNALAAEAERRGVRLLCPELEEPLTVWVDPKMLETAVRAVLRNAIEAAPADGWACVRVKRAGSEGIDVVVEDNGPGPSPTQREHMFDPFYSGRPAGRGRGLGLSIAWRLMHEQGGDIRFERCPDGPTRFALRLPPAAADAGHGAVPTRNGACAVK
ncbi:MAG: ATP-binding protein [Gemmataceae bacterium]|nr:ATP-binding protein [Gemmataceae bacterium]MDW8264720.1 ATP-binding protein [Gemmataceae bacterium]